MKYEVTPSQRGMVLHQAVHPTDNSFDLAFIWKVTGRVDRDRLRAAIDHVVGDMTAFRTSYSTVGGQLLAHVNDGLSATTTLDIPNGLSTAQTEAWIQNYLGRKIDGGPYDLSAECQMLCAIGSTEDATYVAVHTAHIAGDAYSCYAMLDAMSACYDADDSQWASITQRLREHPGTVKLVEPGESELAALSSLYDDVESFSNDAITAARTRGRITGQRTSFQVPHQVVENLRGSEAFSEFGTVAVLYAAYASLIHRVSSSDDFTIGIPIADRSGVTGKSASGFFVNTLPLPLHIDQSTTWRDLLTAVKRGLSVLQRSKSVYPLTLHQEQVCPQTINHTLDNAVTYYRQELKPNFSGCTSTSIPVERSTVPYPIMVTFADSSDSIAIEMSLSDGLGDSGLDKVLIEDLGEIANAPSSTIVRPDYVAIDDFTPIEEPTQSESVWSRLQDLANRQPEKIAIRAERDLTYRELTSEAAHLATSLHQLDASQHVVLSTPKSADAVVAFIGIMASGRVCVPIDPTTPAARFQHIVDTISAQNSAEVTVLVDRTESHRASVISACKLTTVHNLLARSNDGAESFARNDIAYVIFTSGSTGRPKGVEVKHSGMLPLFDGVISTMCLSKDDTWIWLHSSNFDYSIWEIFCPLSLGATLSIPDAQTQSDPLALANHLRDHAVTVLCETPAGLKRFTRVVDDHPYLFTTIRVLTIGGEAFSASELAPWRKLMFAGLSAFNMYGLTENTVVATVLPMDLVEPDNSTNLIGYPVDSLSAICIDRYGRLSRPGVSGELYLAGAGIARGYLGLPDETRSRFKLLQESDGTVRRWLATGDLCHMTDQGLVYHGRIDNQIQLRGFRIELGELEATALSLDAVKSAIAVKIDSVDGDFLALWFVGEVPESSLRAHLRNQLPSYMVPAVIVAIEELPTTINGKTDTSALIDDLKENTSPVHTSEAKTETAANSLESEICRIWSEVTGHPDVAPTSRLFDIGGTSLDAVEITRRLNELPHPVELDVVDLFEYTTPAELAAHVGAPKTKEYTS
ncbi:MULTISPECIES: amino acid adenylation domain-containing protein [Brevibacterium]|uniref:Non-ribosomal peptide synthetase n=1 Tax=Brevibacterium aurantiacum TaxID=273384 RepID=A0A4Z0KJL7_BREAU|nr:amino acid adenylation domain-containing protein [Brevibacterium aurantiacum]TGD37553.1 non-ribosomal peptide synthetase [Brevibacterium aurantiacum]